MRFEATSSPAKVDVIKSNASACAFSEFWPGGSTKDLLPPSPPFIRKY